MITKRRGHGEKAFSRRYPGVRTFSLCMRWGRGEGEGKLSPSGFGMYGNPRASSLLGQLRLPCLFY